MTDTQREDETQQQEEEEQPKKRKNRSLKELSPEERKEYLRQQQREWRQKNKQYLATYQRQYKQQRRRLTTRDLQKQLQQALECQHQLESRLKRLESQMQNKEQNGVDQDTTDIEQPAQKKRKLEQVDYGSGNEENNTIKAKAIELLKQDYSPETISTELNVKLGTIRAWKAWLTRTSSQ